MMYYQTSQQGWFNRVEKWLGSKWLIRFCVATIGGVVVVAGIGVAKTDWSNPLGKYCSIDGKCFSDLNDYKLHEALRESALETERIANKFASDLANLSAQWDAVVQSQNMMQVARDERAREIRQRREGTWTSSSTKK